MSLFTEYRSVPRNLLNFGDVSVRFIRLLEKKIRRDIATSSVDFVRELAWELEDESLVDMVSDKYVQYHNNALACLPVFWGFKVLLKAGLDKGIPIVLRTKFLKKEGDNYSMDSEKVLFFKPKINENHLIYVLAEPDEADLAISSIIVEGVACIDSSFCKLKWQDQVSNHLISDIILACAAEHKQYVDPTLQVEIDSPEYNYYIELAKKKGFSIHNPSLFFANHIYSAQGSKFLQLPETEKVLSANN